MWNGAEAALYCVRHCALAMKAHGRNRASALLNNGYAENLCVCVFFCEFVRFRSVVGKLTYQSYGVCAMLNTFVCDNVSVVPGVGWPSDPIFLE